MTNEKFHEAEQLVDGGMSINKAAKHVGLSYSALYRWLHKDATPQAATEPEPETEPDSYRHALIRRHENETRKNQGLPPLTTEQWAAEKAKLEECERQTEQLLRNSNDN